MNAFYTRFPDRESLLSWYNKYEHDKMPEVNGHIHTPYSFSAFSDSSLAFQMARQEGISVLGINDFFTFDGYPEFSELALEYKIFPLFNIEFMALQHQLQKDGIRVNDPGNPGRTYFSGKGLRFPVSLSKPAEQKIRALQGESNRQTYQMVEKLNEFFKINNIPITFDPEELHRNLAKQLFRERHIAQAVRHAVFATASSSDERKSLFNRIFSGKDVIAPESDVALLENEIRNNLLKAGGVAFVPEDSKAFPELKEVIDIIIDAGGIPCYPVLLDDAKGKFTEFEKDWESLYNNLVENDVWAVELIPGRNNDQILKDFVAFFHERKFIITFGTEHNTPKLDPLRVACRGDVPLDSELKAINHEGAAVIAAHQFLIASDEEGYLKGRKAKIDKKDEFSELGKAVIAWFNSSDSE